MATKKEVGQVLKVMRSVYNNKMTEMQAKVYVQLFSEYPRTVLASAALSAIEQEQYFPRPAEFRKHVDIALRSAKHPVDCYQIFDEASLWLMFVEGIGSVDELTQVQVDQLRKEAGVPAFEVVA